MSEKVVNAPVSPDEGKEATSCIALGTGVAVLGAGAAAATGAVCPLCFLIAPGLIGYGSYKKWRASRATKKGGSDDEL